MDNLIQKLQELSNQSLMEKYMQLDINQRALWNTAYRMLEIGYYDTKDFYTFCHKNNLPIF
jgi:hypothetical protein